MYIVDIIEWHDVSNGWIHCRHDDLSYPTAGGSMAGTLLYSLAVVEYPTNFDKGCSKTCATNLIILGDEEEKKKKKSWGGVLCFRYPPDACALIDRYVLVCTTTVGTDPTHTFLPRDHLWVRRIVHGVQ